MAENDEDKDGEGVVLYCLQLEIVPEGFALRGLMSPLGNLAIMDDKFKKLVHDMTVAAAKTIGEYGGDGYTAYHAGNPELAERMADELGSRPKESKPADNEPVIDWPEEVH